MNWLNKQRVRILSHITWGKTRKHYKEKYNKIYNAFHQSIAVIDKINYIADRITYIEKFMKFYFPIENTPHAKGDLRQVQLSSAAILSHFSQIAQKYNLTWWLDSGTLIGYLRHNDFVPWDDDLDIAMMRSDYDRLKHILKKEFNSNGFYYCIGEITRLYYKNIHVWVDIFPMDTGYSQIPPQGKELDSFFVKLAEIKSQIDWDDTKWKNHKQPVSDKYLRAAKDYRDNILVPNPVKNGFIFYGVEVFVRSRCVFSHSDIFPLKKINFLGIKAFIPNRSEKYLSLMYNNWRDWPKNFASVHGKPFFASMKQKDREVCLELINNYLKGQNLW